MSSALRTHGLQHARLLCPSPTSRTCSNSSIKSVMPFNHLILCHPLSSCLQSFSAAGFFQMSQFCTSIDQSIRASASALIIPINTQDWFPLGLTGLITLQSKGFSRAFSNTKVQKHQFFGTQLVFLVQLSHLYVTTGKAIALSIWTFNLHFYLQEQPFVSGFAYFLTFIATPYSKPPLLELL